VPASYDASAKSARARTWHKRCEHIDAVLAKDEDRADFVPGVGGARAKTTRAGCEPLGPSALGSGQYVVAVARQNRRAVAEEAPRDLGLAAAPGESYRAVARSSSLAIVPLTPKLRAEFDCEFARPRKRGGSRGERNSWAAGIGPKSLILFGRSGRI
jgi:hypothetical protein